MTSVQSREILQRNQELLLTAMNRPAAQSTVKADVDHVHVKCDGCGGGGSSHIKRFDGKPLPCKTCGGKGSYAMSTLKKTNPEKYSRLRKLHAGEG